MNNKKIFIFNNIKKKYKINFNNLIYKMPYTNNQYHMFLINMNKEYNKIYNNMIILNRLEIIKIISMI